LALLLAELSLLFVAGLARGKERERERIRIDREWLW
jgi:hypothetical protein